MYESMAHLGSCKWLAMARVKDILSFPVNKHDKPKPEWDKEEL